MGRRPCKVGRRRGTGIPVLQISCAHTATSGVSDVKHVPIRPYRATLENQALISAFSGVSMRTVTINREPVELYKILKFEGLVDSGAEAKTAIAQGLVLVNGEVETRKRRKMLGGDTIKFAGEELKLQLG
jgi:ribosome-associated protein